MEQQPSYLRPVNKWERSNQFVGTSKVCDQNGNRVSKTNYSCHICSMRLKSVLAKYEKYGTLFINY